MFSIRLGKDLEHKLKKVAQSKKKTNSAVVKEALSLYLDDAAARNDPFSLGKDLFGKYGSGKRNLSQTYKKRIKSKINEKLPH